MPSRSSCLLCYKGRTLILIVIVPWIIVMSSQLAAVSVGGAVTYPTLLIERFRTNDTSMQLDMDTKTWIGSIYGLAGIPSILMPIIAQKIGRKWGYITACLCIMLGWIFAYRATSAAEILISESFHGLGSNGLLPVCYIAMTEMLAPKYRHISMQAFGIAQGVGMAACGILGRYLHYKIVSILMLVPIATATALALIWIESPSWFACRGEFDKCERAFIKLRGVDELSKIELLSLITAQKENLSSTSREKVTIKKLREKIARKDFYLPSFHIFVVLLIMYWGGNDAIYIYFIEIVKKSTNSDNTVFYASIIMYIIVLGGLCITNIVIRKYKNKTVLFCGASGAVACLLISSLLSGLKTVGVLSDSSSLLVYSLIVYIACSSIGFHSIVFIIAVELMPVKHRSLGGALLILFNCILYASSLKLSPYITQYIGLWCTFLVYALNISACLWFILKYVPETKERSLQELEDYYMFGRFIQRSVEEESNCLQSQLGNTDTIGPTQYRSVGRDKMVIQ